MKALSSIKINQGVTASLLKHISNNIGISIPQSLMIVGAFGTGKSTLMRNASIQLKKEGCNVVWIDGRTLFSTKNLIGALALNKNQVVFIDDVDYYFNRVSVSDQNIFRDYLNSKGAPLLIGSISEILPAFTSYKAPFSENMNFVYVDLLDMNELWTQLFSEEQQQRARFLARFLSPTIHHAEEIYSIVKGRKGYDLLQLIEKHSEFYISQYNQMSCYSQNILNGLSDYSEGLTMAELRHKTGLPTNILSSYLRTLKDNGIIVYDFLIKGKTKYTIKDPLFRRWLMVEPMSRL